jgi:hypothetical protein
VDITSFPFPSKLIEAEDDTVIALVATSVEQFDELALRDLTSWSWTTSGKYIGLAIVVNGKTMPLVRFDTRLAHHREALEGALREGVLRIKPAANLEADGELIPGGIRLDLQTFDRLIVSSMLGG